MSPPPVDRSEKSQTVTRLTGPVSFFVGPETNVFHVLPLIPS